MNSLQSYTRIVHADWSSLPRKRWAAAATKRHGRWSVEAPSQVNDTSDFLDYLNQSSRLTLAGFDFPIGLPKLYGEKTGINDFGDALAMFGQDRWAMFYEVADRADEISLYRPFYPRRSTNAARQRHLIDAHGCGSMDELRRECELATINRNAACSLFWTLGGNQVGKAAIEGWKEIVAPALQFGANIWPFHGSLSTLAKPGGLVIAETYPAETYGHLGIKFAPGESKRRRQDRIRLAPRIHSWSASNATLTPELATLVDDGFGHSSYGEDIFDAVIGAFGMIEVVEGRRPEGPNEYNDWEGWILGQHR